MKYWNNTYNKAGLAKLRLASWVRKNYRLTWPSGNEKNCKAYKSEAMSEEEERGGEWLPDRKESRKFYKTTKPSREQQGTTELLNCGHTATPQEKEKDQVNIK